MAKRQAKCAEPRRGRQALSARACSHNLAEPCCSTASHSLVSLCALARIVASAPARVAGFRTLPSSYVMCIRGGSPAVSNKIWTSDWSCGRAVRRRYRVSRQTGVQQVAPRRSGSTCQFAADNSLRRSATPSPSYHANNRATTGPYFYTSSTGAGRCRRALTLACRCLSPSACTRYSPVSCLTTPKAVAVRLAARPNG